jgi:hypothetical protein
VSFGGVELVYLIEDGVVDVQFSVTYSLVLVLKLQNK